MRLNKFNLNKKEYICLLILFGFSFLTTFKMMIFSCSGGILNPDTSLYLLSALKYAGLDYYDVVNPQDLFYTPIISFLTSLLFRLGFVHKNAIILVTSILCLIGYFALYILLKMRFNSLLSLTGVIIYGSLSVVIFNLSKGLIDIPVVSISMWVLVFAIYAIDKNPKYFLIAFPLLVIAFFVKYVSGFILPLILFYYIINRDFPNLIYCLIYDFGEFKQNVKKFFISIEFKYLLISLLISAVLAILICKYLLLDFGCSLNFINQSVNTFNGQSISSTAINYNIQKSYYLKELPNILFEKRDLNSILSAIIFGILGLGVILYLINFFKNNVSKLNIKTNKSSLILVSIFILTLFSAVIVFKVYSNHMVTNILLLISFTVLYFVLQLNNIDDKYLSLDLLFLVYLTINLVFISTFGMKVFRYALPFIPALIYFIILGLDSICTFLNKIFKKHEKIVNIIPILLICIFLFSTFNMIEPMEIERSNDVYSNVLYKGFVNDLSDTCDFIVNNDSNYHSKTFASYFHHSRTIRWYLNVNVTILDESDSNLDKFNETDYIILNENKTFKNYNLINNIGDFYVYYHK